MAKTRTVNYGPPVWNLVAKRFRDNFPTGDYYSHLDDDLRRDDILKRHMLSVLMLDFAEGFKRDNSAFDPIKWLDQCSPDIDAYPLSELWEVR